MTLKKNKARQDANMRKLKKKVTKLCKKAGILQKELANALGVAPSGLSALSGERPINHILIALLTNIQADSKKKGKEFLALIEQYK